MKKMLALILILVMMVPVIALGEYDGPIVGKWSCYFDVTKMEQAIQDVMDNSLIIYDIYLMRDGSAYMTNASLDKNETKPDFSFGALSGVWVGDGSGLVIKISDTTYTAKFSDDNYMLLYLTENLPLPFTRVETTYKMMELVY